MAERQPIPADPRFQDFTERRVGPWEVLWYTGYSRWWCRCRCGLEKELTSQVLLKRQSPGCRHGETLEVRFWSRVRVSRAGCWLWQGPKFDSGYGAIHAGHNNVAANRVSYELNVGSIPEGGMVLHRCDNRACVRPDHLFIGSHSDNMIDMVEKGRSSRGQRHHNAKLTEAKVVEIKKRLADGETKTSIAISLGVSRGTISHIATGRNWGHLANG